MGRRRVFIREGLVRVWRIVGVLSSFRIYCVLGYCFGELMFLCVIYRGGSKIREGKDVI